MLAASLVVSLILGGCASSDVGDYKAVADQTRSRPSHIQVYDFAVIPADIPADAPIGARLSPGASPSPEQIAKDRQLGSNMAAQLVAALREMELPAEHAAAGAVPQFNVIIIRGCFISVQETNAAKRFTIGLDFRSAELMTAVEGFQVTEQGVGRSLDLGVAGANTNSGTATGVIFTTGTKVTDEASFRASADTWARQTVKEIADRLKVKFQEQGWMR
jgi:hypothetical protein